MKKVYVCLLLLSFSIIKAQYKEQLNTSGNILDGVFNGNSSSLFSFINPDNFSMHHTFDISYSAFGGEGVALGVYTNSMMYKISNNLNVQADLSVVNSPYSSFGKDFAKQINGFYLSRAQINYKPTDNMSIVLQYRNIPMSYYSPYSYYGDYGWGYSSFLNSGFNDFDVRSSGN